MYIYIYINIIYFYQKTKQHCDSDIIHFQLAHLRAFHCMHSVLREIAVEDIPHKTGCALMQNNLWFAMFDLAQEDGKQSAARPQESSKKPDCTNICAHCSSCKDFQNPEMSCGP